MAKEDEGLDKDVRVEGVTSGQRLNILCKHS